MQELPERVRAVTDRLMAHVDARLPGQLEGFYLVGSVAQGDYREGRSDVDFIAVLAGPHEVDVLARIHADLAHAFAGLSCDGIYVHADELAAPPGGEGVRAHEGKVGRSDGERHPVSWLLLADEGIALRGPAPNASWVAADRDAAIDYSRKNLGSYWQRWLDGYRRSVPATRETSIADAAVTWGALGVARVHATIASGHVPSKTAAGIHALDAFARHGRIIGEGLRLRTEPETLSRYASHEARRHDLIAFMEEAISSARI